MNLQTPEMSPDLQEAYAVCRGIAQRSNSSFARLFWLIQDDRRRALDAIYAFCRLADDIGDDGDDREEQTKKLGELRVSLQRAIDGETLEASRGADQLFSQVSLALSHSMRRFKIPTWRLLRLLDGVQSDIDGCKFATDQQLNEYCHAVAGVVGQACLPVWGFDHSEKALDLADMTGRAFQRTDILRDIREDAARGRVYLSEEVLQNYGISREDILAGRLGSRWDEMILSQVQVACDHYKDASPLLPHVSPMGRCVIRAMTRSYQALLEKIAANPKRAWERRISLPAWKKGQIAGLGCLEMLIARAMYKAPLDLYMDPDRFGNCPPCS